MTFLKKDQRNRKEGKDAVAKNKQIKNSSEIKGLHWAGRNKGRTHTQKVFLVVVGVVSRQMITYITKG